MKVVILYRKGEKMPVVNNLKTLIRQKQEAYKAETGKLVKQYLIADEIGIDPATLSQYMNGKIGSVNWEVWQKLANYFGVSGDEIFNVQPDETGE
jgi:DNA transposition AAA+ family ATPase